MNLYLDSSVLMKLYKQEADSEIMDEVIHRIDKGEWRGFSSKWSFLEIARALKKDKKPKEVVTVDLEDLRSQKIEFISLGDDLVPIAEELIKESNLYAADAFHIASFKYIKKADAFLCGDKHFNRLRGIIPVKRLSEIGL